MGAKGSDQKKKSDKMRKSIAAASKKKSFGAGNTPVTSSFKHQEAGRWWHHLVERRSG